MSERRCRDCNRLQDFGARCDVCGGVLLRDFEPRQDELPPPSETERVENWRLHTLLEAGYPPQLAEPLAQRPWTEVDLHQAVELVKRGCPTELAGQILL